MQVDPGSNPIIGNFLEQLISLNTKFHWIPNFTEYQISLSTKFHRNTQFHWKIHLSKLHGVLLGKYISYIWLSLIVSVKLCKNEINSKEEPDKTKLAFTSF